MSRWFRHYAGMMRDEKLVAVAVRSKQPVERVIWIWGAILESAAEINDGGRYEFDNDEAAYFLRCDSDDIRAIMDGLENSKRVDQGMVARWGVRQFNSDTSTDRVRKHRAKRDDSEFHKRRNAPTDSGNASETFLKHDGTPPDTDTDTDTEYNLKQPSPTIPREAGLRSENQDWSDLEAKCRKAAGWENEPHPNLCVIGPIAELIGTGASLELDVLPVIAAHAPRCRAKSGWNYFIGPIRDAIDSRVKARAPPSLANSKAENAAILKALQEKHGWTPGTKAQAG